MTRYHATSDGPIPFTPEEEAEFDAMVQEAPAIKAAEVRKDRDVLLVESDWVVVKAAETNSAIPTEWAAYRQALRDVPQQAEFPTNIKWPTKP
jgi:hypothetical protein